MVVPPAIIAEDCQCRVVYRVHDTALEASCLEPGSYSYLRQGVKSDTLVFRAVVTSHFFSQLPVS